ncbi:MAG: redoxin domain-containing protein [Gammaproteobacteria bacterium]|nr:redoxin domain-containing protein [Gammaproteobacteria bacterium]
MSLKLGNIAPNFTADTTHGMINFYEWMNNSWTVLLSHPKNFTQVCATELVWLSENHKEFTDRNVKVISLSVEKLIQHSKWLDEIKNSYNIKILTPLISDKSLRIAKLYNMIHGLTNDQDSTENGTVRSTYIISPNKKIISMYTYPANIGRNFNEVLRVLDSLFVTDGKDYSTPVNWKRGDDYISQNVTIENCSASHMNAIARNNQATQISQQVA